MDFKNCIEKGNIIEDKSALNWVKSELVCAENFLNQAEKILDLKVYESVEMIGYMSIFHSSRALLFNKGYREKGHYCLFVSLIEMYSQNEALLELVKCANRIRQSRHEASYGGKTIDEKEAIYVIEVAKRFLDMAKIIVK